MSAPRFLIQRDPGGVCLAYFEDELLVEYERHDESAQCLVGRVMLGRVARALTGMNAAFVNIGLERNGFLPVLDGALPRDGDTVLVQIKKPPLGEKGAFLTRDITLPGALCMLLPYGRGVGVSRRVRGAERDALHALGKAVQPEHMGLVVRAAALTDPDGLPAEVSRLLAEWKTVQNRARTAKPPAVLLEGAHPADAMARDLRRVSGVHMETNDAEALERLGHLFESARLTEAPVTNSGAEALYRRALGRTHRLKCGGTLVIDPCEAMTVIDVNSGAETGGRGGIEQTALTVNLEAADEIARLLRLRGVGGIVVVDLIDMEQSEHRNAVLERMRAALRNDRVKAEALGFTRLGLMEITRKRTGAPDGEGTDEHD